VSLSQILHRRSTLASVSALAPHLLPGSPRAPNCLLSRSRLDVAARFPGTTASGRRAFWCRTDNLVVFDGASFAADGGWAVATRSSKGVARANARGEEVVVRVDVQCAHCWEMLGMKVWKYKARVCRRGVCGECRRRCLEMHEEEMRARREAAGTGDGETTGAGNGETTGTGGSEAVLAVDPAPGGMLASGEGSTVAVKEGCTLAAEVQGPDDAPPILEGKHSTPVDGTIQQPV
jgi:hypothetical protein